MTYSRPGRVPRAQRSTCGQVSMRGCIEGASDDGRACSTTLRSAQPPGQVPRLAAPPRRGNGNGSCVGRGPPAAFYSFFPPDNLQLPGLPCLPVRPPTPTALVTSALCFAGTRSRCPSFHLVSWAGQVQGQARDSEHSRDRKRVSLQKSEGTGA